MNIFSRYLIKNLLLGFAAAAALLLPLFSTFDFISELDDVGSGDYRWTMALLVILMKLPRCCVDLGPFIALLGGIAGLGQLSKSLELTAMRSAGMSIFKIGLTALFLGMVFTLLLSAIDEWVASPLQQRALQLKSAAMSQGDDSTFSGNQIWARHNNEYVTVKTLDNSNQPLGVEIFHYRDDLTLESYVHARRAVIVNNDLWMLLDVNRKNWIDGKETTTSVAQMPWHSLFGDVSPTELMMPAGTFSIEQLVHYINYLNATEQPDLEFQIALWQKVGRAILILAMILMSVPFAFSQPRAPGLGSRLALGVLTGLGIYISYQIVVNLGLLFSLSAPLSALAPPLILLTSALAVVRNYNRKAG